MPMRIVHLSNNSLAGAPIRLVRALRNHTDHDLRLVDLKRYPLELGGYYEYDVVFEETGDKAIEIVRKADVLHLHNYIDLESDAFSPLNFKELKKQGEGNHPSFPQPSGHGCQTDGQHRVRRARLPAAFDRHRPVPGTVLPEGAHRAEHDPQGRSPVQAPGRNSPNTIFSSRPQRCSGPGKIAGTRREPRRLSG